MEFERKWQGSAQWTSVSGRLQAENLCFHQGSLNLFPLLEHEDKSDPPEKRPRLRTHTQYSSQRLIGIPVSQQSFADSIIQKTFVGYLLWWLRR